MKAPWKRNEGISEEQVRQVLRQVQEPVFQRDLVSLEMVKDIGIKGSKVSLTLELATPAHPLKEQIAAACREAVEQIEGVNEVEVALTANVVPHHAGDGQQAPLPGVKNIFAIGSGKGGVGKSTVSANLALALARYGAKVGLLDGDVYGPSIPMLLGIQADEKPAIQGNQMIPLTKYGIKVMSLGLLIEEDTAVVWRGPMLGKAVQQMLHDVAWGELDYLVIDLPPGTGDVQLTLAQSVPLAGAVVVTTPQNVALLDVRRAIGMFQRVQTPLLGIIENMSYFLCPHCGQRTDIFKHGGGRVASEKLGIPFLGEIPLDPSISIGGDEGTPVVAVDPEAQQTKIYMEIAGAVALRISLLNFEATRKPTIRWTGKKV
ncbi:MAG: iron-sulfur cluster carrier protein ApbC [Nitrospinota bacterium]|nr:MAG: iron-sulfur cluster carrier protein ApbC [Nitrospinota bacterium]